MKFIISGGGTGGHIFPAIAIAEALKRQDSQAEFLFIGANDRMEMEKVPKAGYKIEGLWISGFNRKKLWKNFALPFKIISSSLKAGRIIKQFKPDAIIGVGGYASWVALNVAGRRGLPTLIHEQNSFAGKSNQMLAKRANTVCVAYDKMDRFFPKEKIVLTGNPIRQDILDVSEKREEGCKHYGFDPKKKILFLTGGSLGARTLNESMALHLQSLVDAGIQVLWQAGKTTYEEFRPLAEKYQGVNITAFVDRMDLAYAMADLVVARAGALTISELCQTGKAAILVPSPNVAEDHQTANAMALVEKDAVLYIKDAVARQELVPKALELLKNEDALNKLKHNIKELALPNAADDIAKEVLKIVKK